MTETVDLGACLVTGGGGFFGQHLVNALLDREEHGLRVVVRLREVVAVRLPDLRRLRHQRPRIVPAPLSDPLLRLEPEVVRDRPQLELL